LAEPWLIAGLGNPGEKYARSRHNAGAMVIERLADRLGTRLRKVRFVSVHAAEGRAGEVPLLLLTPATFMNVSGPPIASFARKRKVPVERVVACHDDIDLAFGALRIKKGGSTAGHHGLDSMVQSFHSADFYRVRIGIGRPPGRWENIDYVLEPFPKRHREDVDVLIEDAADAVLSLVGEGLSVAQDRFNRPGFDRGSGRCLRPSQ
jgi:PTH1 family peptidyl-tRNA hydrolase